MKVYGVTMDWQIKICFMGSAEMMEMRNVHFSKAEAEQWISNNKTDEQP